jgi:hypothetical protein
MAQLINVDFQTRRKVEPRPEQTADTQHVDSGQSQTDAARQEIVEYLEYNEDRICADIRFMQDNPAICQRSAEIADKILLHLGNYLDVPGRLRIVGLKRKPMRASSLSALCGDLAKRGPCTWDMDRTHYAALAIEFALRMQYIIAFNTSRGSMV